MTDTIRIATDAISAEISPLGAELQLLRDEAGRDLLHDGDPAFWTGRAPILFPIVGAVRDDRILVDGTFYPIAKHGFARRSRFTLVERAPASATFRLTANDVTRAQYPFDFQLDLRFTVSDASLEARATLANPGDAPLPASFGFHPAFRWPLPWGGARADHRLIFAQDETAPIRRIDAAGLLRPDRQPTPVAVNELALSDRLFDDDALIFDALASRAVRFGVPGERTIDVAFPAMSLLGVWTKPGAP
ncbi:MAG TPA: aldose 1-epimerase family protein, partial [Sphingomonas sp.]|nr:aldose 1-epimerase family protein [Sphingomonas sp.]